MPLSSMLKNSILAKVFGALSSRSIQKKQNVLFFKCSFVIPDILFAQIVIKTCIVMSCLILFFMLLML